MGNIVDSATTGTSQPWTRETCASLRIPVTKYEKSLASVIDFLSPQTSHLPLQTEEHPTE